MAGQKVMETKNYAMFKRLVGNRYDIERRAKLLKKSILEYGQIIPIMVNDRNEVIDGQARLECCKTLDIPVRYIVDSRLDITSCREANSTSNKWKLINYIDSYAESGNVSYIYLKHIISRYSAIGIKTCITVTTGMVEWRKIIKNGRLVCDEKQYEEACATLSYCMRFVPFMKNAKGRLELYYMAFGFCYLLPDVDNDLLYEKVLMNQLDLIPIATMEQALTVIERIYNFRLSSKKKVMIVQKYKESLAKRFSWYMTRYGGENNG